MLTLLNAQERSATEFRALFAAASPGFRFGGVTRPKGCRMSIIEAVWEGEDYSVEPSTPVDTPLVTPVDAKADQDKGLPVASTTKVEPKVEPKIEEGEAAVGHNETTESFEAETTSEAVDAATQKIEAMILNSDVEKTVNAPDPSHSSPTTHNQVTDTVA